MLQINDWNRATKKPIATLEALAKQADDLALRTAKGIACLQIDRDWTITAIRLVTAANDAKRRLRDASTSLELLADTHRAFYFGPK